MPEKTEMFGRTAAVKGTMLQAHLTWADGKLQGARPRLEPLVQEECARLISHAVLATDWIPFRCLVAIDRAIAAAVGGTAKNVFRDLGRHSATLNLAGAYKGFIDEEPHRFFQQMAVLHRRFQNFGQSSYEKRGPRSGSIRLEGYGEYSPVFCESGVGYYEGALEMMKVPGPIYCAEPSCQCAGEPACVFELSW
jgi:hypothetical protein